MKHKLTLVLLSFFLGVQCMVAQQMKVTGVVINEDDGEPVIGASIVVKGTTIGTITDLDGKFELETQKDAKLIISYVGLRTQETTAQQNMRIVLSSDSQAIDEVVVVAYGTAKKSSFTGSASTVGAALMDKRPLSNALSALEGNTSGVQMTSSIGQPGEAAKVTIRGFGSVNADNAPLYVVDGAIFSGDISSISPSDIESMTILKDAASTSLYGSSAGNGVVLITTKKGSTSSGAGVTLSISQGWSSRAYNDYAKVGVYDYYPLQWQMLRNANMSLGQSATDAAANASKDIINKLKYNPFVGIANDAIVGTDGLLNPSASALKWGEDLDWEDAAYRTGHRQEYNVSYNTKTEKSDTYASIGYLNDKGYMIKTDSNKDLIAEIMGGIKKEVSTSTVPSKMICNICGTDNMKDYCRHWPGIEYTVEDGSAKGSKKRCKMLLSGAKEAYELSFVAVPAQPRAGTHKSIGFSKPIKDPEIDTKNTENELKNKEMDARLLAQRVKNAESFFNVEKESEK